MAKNPHNILVRSFNIVSSRFVDNYAGFLIKSALIKA